MGEPIRVMPDVAPRKRNNCLIGCIVSIIIAAVLVFLLFLAGSYVYKQVLESFTSTAPEPLPPVSYTEEEAAAVQERVAGFEAAMQGDAAAPRTIELTAQDLNILLNTDPRVNAFAQSVYVDILDDTLKAQVSMPFDFLPGMEGRYINGSATLDLDVVNDTLVISITEFVVHGNSIPGEALGQLEAEINKNLNQQPEVREVAGKVESIEVQDGRVRITLKEGTAVDGN